MATASKAPTSDENVVGAWTGSVGSRYTLVDDYPDTVPTDVIDSPTAAGGAQITFGYTAFAIPAGSVSISVQVRYYDRDVTNGTNSSGGRLKVGGNYYNAATHNPNTTLTARSDNWATNPKTTVAWTVDDINGVGANALQAVGFNCGDASPALRYSSVEIQVTYTPPANASMSATQADNTIVASATVEVAASMSKTQEADSLSASLTVEASSANASLSQTQADNGITASSTVEVAASASIAQAGDSLASGAVVDVAVFVSITQGASSIVAGAVVEVVASASITQGGQSLAGSIGNEVIVDLAVSQSANSMVAAAGIEIAASLSKAQDGNSLVASIDVEEAGINVSLSAQQGADSLSAQIDVEEWANVSVAAQQDANSLVASVTVSGEGSGINLSAALVQTDQALLASFITGPIFVNTSQTRPELLPPHVYLYGTYAEWELMRLHNLFHRLYRP